MSDSKFRKTGSLYERAREIIADRRAYLTETPPDQWMPVGPVVLASILRDSERDILPPSVRKDTAREQKIIFGEELDSAPVSYRGRKPAAPEADSGEVIYVPDSVGKDDENRTLARYGGSANGGGTKNGGNPNGKIVLANGRRTLRK